MDNQDSKDSFPLLNIITAVYLIIIGISQLIR